MWSLQRAEWILKHPEAGSIGYISFGPEFAAAMRPVEASPLPGEANDVARQWFKYRHGEKMEGITLGEVIALGGMIHSYAERQHEQATVPLREALELLNIIDHGDGRVWVMTRVDHKNKVGSGSVMVEGELAEAFRNLKRKQEAALSAHPTKAEAGEVDNG